MQFAIAVPGEVSHLALSRDGSMLVFVAPEENSGLPMLYVQRLGSANPTPLPGTEDASYPFWSPDGANVAFFAHGKLQKIAVSGGTPQVLANVLAARGGSWGRRDVILYAPNAESAIWRVNPDGTGAAPVTQSVKAEQDQSNRWPVFLPDGRHFLYYRGGAPEVTGIYVGSLDAKPEEQNGEDVEVRDQRVGTPSEIGRVTGFAVRKDDQRNHHRGYNRIKIEPGVDRLANTGCALHYVA